MTVDLGTRRLRYFIAVAEELNFTRAAARLFVAQQSLSQQIRQLEADMGVELLLRSTKRVELTRAGAVFLDDARRLVTESAAAVERARTEAAHKSAVLRLGFIPVGLRAATQRVLTSFARLHPHVRVQLQETSWQDPSAGLLDGTSDVGIVLLPNDLDGIDSVPVQTSEACVALPEGHPLAVHESIDAEQLRGLPLVGYDVPAVSFLNRWNIAPPAVRARTAHHWLAEVATGQGVGVTAVESATRRSVHGVTFRRAVGLPGMTIGFAARSDDGNDVVRMLLHEARRLGNGASSGA